MTVIHINIEIAKPEDEEKFILGLKSLADALVQKEYFVCPPIQNETPVLKAV